MNGACLHCKLPVATPGGYGLFTATKDHMMTLQFHNTPEGADQKINDAKAGGSLGFAADSMFNISKDTSFGFVRVNGKVMLRIGNKDTELPQNIQSCVLINTCNQCIQERTPGAAKVESDPSRQSQAK